MALPGFTFELNLITCQVLSYSCIMLNTLLHNPAVKDKPSLERWLSTKKLKYFIIIPLISPTWESSYREQPNLSQLMWTAPIWKKKSEFHWLELPLSLMWCIWNHNRPGCEIVNNSNTGQIRGDEQGVGAAERRERRDDRPDLRQHRQAAIQAAWCERLSITVI